LNLAPEQSLLPSRGVYITRTCLEGESLSRRSVTNIGMRPTFNGSALSIETHILDWAPGPLAPGFSSPRASKGPASSSTSSLDVDTTGEPFESQVERKPAFTPKHIELRFWQRLRDEKKFAGPEELRSQIARDIASANKFFARLRRLRSLRTVSVSAPRS
jgi:hypothetical protein